MGERRSDRRADRLDRLPSGAYRARISLGGRRYAATFASEPRAALWLAELRARHAQGEPLLPGVAVGHVGGGAEPAHSLLRSSHDAASALDAFLEVEEA